MKKTMRLLTISVLSWLAVLTPSVFAAEVNFELKSLLATIRRVQSDGQGNPEAAHAWQQLVKSDSNELTTILAALDGAGPLAANWLRSAVDTIAERTLADGKKLPAHQLEQFALNTKHNARVRRLAYEWLVRVDPSAADRVIPVMLHDPGAEFRRDAVARLLDQADVLLKDNQEPQAAKVYREALGGARDDDQIKIIVEQLDSLGYDVDVPRHFGFLMNWHIIGPFDNTGRQGFDKVFLPEDELKLDARYAGTNGAVGWTSHTTQDDYGMVDLNRPFGKIKESVAYAWTNFISDGERQVELRLGCKTAWKLWLNGELVFGREEYHRGIRLDQYRMKVKLKPGRNQILIKVCQNEQTESWTVEWQFQLRVCDTAGTAILSTGRPRETAGAQ